MRLAAAVRPEIDAGGGRLVALVGQGPAGSGASGGAGLVGTDALALSRPGFGGALRPYILFNTPIRRPYAGTLWAEGPAWSGVGRYLVWSDIPNNRQLRWLEDGNVWAGARPSVQIIAPDGAAIGIIRLPD